MEVKPGYKQTDVGVIPKDWDIMPFIRAVESYIDYRGRTPRKLGLAWGGGDILALSANNVQMGGIDLDKEAYFGSEELYQKWMVQGECERGDVLLTMEAPLGNVAQIPDSKKYILSQRVLLIKPKDWLRRDFLTHYMKGSFFQKQLALNSTGSTAKGIQRGRLNELLVYLPPTKAEQEAIAEALSDVDTLIESIEQLIAKKRDLKQASMQALLTGKKRLPGFSGEWAKYSINELEAEGMIKLYRGKVISRRDIENTPGDYPIYSSSNMNRGQFGKYGNFMFDEELITWSIDGGGNFFHRPKHRFSVTNVCGYIRVDTKKVNYQFLAGQLQVLHAKLHFDYLIKAHPSVIRGLYTIGLTDINEQTAIAAILSDMDAEITALESHLAKVHHLKQGMMQELLTGRTRLI